MKNKSMKGIITCIYGSSPLSGIRGIQMKLEPKDTFHFEVNGKKVT